MVAATQSSTNPLFMVLHTKVISNKYMVKGVCHLLDF